MDVFEIGSNCPPELINPRKAVRDPNDFFDGIVKRQAELMQKHYEELKKKERPGAPTRRPETTKEDCIFQYYSVLVMKAKRRNHWDSVVKENPEQNKALYTLYKSRKAEVNDFLYLLYWAKYIGN